jgi:hypothetical protein
MLYISLPAAATEGDCRINARPAEFRIEGEQFSCRYRDASAWARFTIVAARPGGALVSYACEDEEEVRESARSRDDHRCRSADPPPAG